MRRKLALGAALVAWRKHDVRCAEMFLRYFGAQTLPRMLTRREWDRFVADRRRGAIAPARSCASAALAATT